MTGPASFDDTPKIPSASDLPGPVTRSANKRTAEGGDLVKRGPAKRDLAGRKVSQDVPSVPDLSGPVNRSGKKQAAERVENTSHDLAARKVRRSDKQNPRAQLLGKSRQAALETNPALASPEVTFGKIAIRLELFRDEIDVGPIDFRLRHRLADYLIQMNDQIKLLSGEDVSKLSKSALAQKIASKVLLIMDHEFESNATKLYEQMKNEKEPPLDWWKGISKKDFFISLDSLRRGLQQFVHPPDLDQKSIEVCRNIAKVLNVKEPAISPKVSTLDPAIEQHFAPDPVEEMNNLLRELATDESDIVLFGFGTQGKKSQETPEYIFELAKQHPTKKIKIIQIEPSFLFTTSPTPYAQDGWVLTKSNPRTFVHTIYPNLQELPFSCGLPLNEKDSPHIANPFQKALESFITRKLDQRKAVFIGSHIIAWTMNGVDTVANAYNHCKRRHPNSENLQLYIQAGRLEARLYGSSAFSKKVAMLDFSRSYDIAEFHDTEPLETDEFNDKKPTVEDIQKNYSLKAMDSIRYTIHEDGNHLKVSNA